MAAPLVLALGGSLLGSEESERHAWLSSLANLLSVCEGTIGIAVSYTHLTLPTILLV